MNNRSNTSIIREMYLKSFLAATISVLMATLGMVVDGVIIGRFLGGDSMASYGMAIPIMPVIIMTGNMLVSGAQLVCGRYIAAGEVDKASIIFTTGMTMGTIVSVILGAVIFSFSAPIARLLGATGDAGNLFSETRNYIAGLSFAFVFIVLSMIQQPFLQIEGDRKRIILSVLLSLVANVTADIVCVSVLHTGLFGIAIATAVSYFVSFLVLLTHFGNSVFRFNLNSIRFGEMKQIVVNGIPMAVDRLSYSLKVIFLNRIVFAIAGTGALTVLSIQNNLYNFFASAALGTGIAALLVSGVLSGENSKSTMNIFIKTITRNGVIINAVIATVLFSFASVFAGIYAKGDGAVIAEASIVIRFFAISLILMAMVSGYISFIQGTGHFRLAIAYIFLHFFGLPIICAWVFGYFFGLMGVWASFLLCELFMIIIFVIVAAVKNGHFPSSVYDFMMLPSSYDIPEDMIHEWSLDDIGGVSLVSQESFDFLKAKDIEKRSVYITSLCIEEMCRNIFENSDRKKRKVSVYVRLAIEKEALVMRIRDNGVLFDPVKWLEISQAEDKTSNIGIRMIVSLTKDFRYINTMGMNTLIIRI